MRDRNDRYQGSSVSALASPKKIGGYLVDAGLLSTDQINVALNDQQATGMRFGEIIVARGWLKEQTVEWIMAKVIEPERQRQRRQSAEPPSNAWANPQRPAAYSHSSSPSSPGGSPSGNPGSGASSSGAGNGVGSTGGYSTAAKAPEISSHKPFARREVPISKPLPSVGSSDGDVNWVG